jgi:hypothetical protein
VNIRRAVVALGAAVLLLFGGAAKPIHSSAPESNVVIWCDGIDDDADDPGRAAVENKKTGDIAPYDLRVWTHVSEKSSSSRAAHEACQAGDTMPRLTTLLFRPRLRTGLCASPSASPIPH